MDESALATKLGVTPLPACLPAGTHARGRARVDATACLRTSLVASLGLDLAQAAQAGSACRCVGVLLTPLAAVVVVVEVVVVVAVVAILRRRKVHSWHPWVRSTHRCEVRRWWV